MYTWEISEFLNSNNYCISSIDYLRIFSSKESPQIIRVKYDAFSNSFTAETNDGGFWSFEVYKS